jgi:LDH2 family malate/lactate/ureidoglycolate dehydrogenase
VFVDPEGRLTADPKVAVDREGTMLFMGGEMEGYKGYAFSLWAEALTAVAGGSCNNPKVESRQSFNLLVIDPEAFGGSGYYRKEMERFVAHVKSSRLRPGAGAIRLPGERARRAEAEAGRRGLPLEAGLFEKLNAIAARHSLAPLKPLP